MPIYEYMCGKCGCSFDLMRRFKEADSPAPCPDCASESKRQISQFAAFSKGAGGASSSVAGGKSCGGCAGGGCSGGGCGSCR